MAITTNKEYLLKSLAKFNITEDDVDVILADSQLSGSGILDTNACKLAVYTSLSSILPLANISESDFSISWNIEALKLWYNALCKELGKPNMLKPSIRNRSNYW